MRHSSCTCQTVCGTPAHFHKLQFYQPRETSGNLVHLHTFYAMCKRYRSILVNEVVLEKYQEMPVVSHAHKKGLAGYQPKSALSGVKLDLSTTKNPNIKNAKDISYYNKKMPMQSAHLYVHVFIPSESVTKYGIDKGIPFLINFQFTSRLSRPSKTYSHIRAGKERLQLLVPSTFQNGGTIPEINVDGIEKNRMNVGLFLEYGKEVNEKEVKKATKDEEKK